MATDARFALALEAFEKALSRLKEVLAENETTIVRDALPATLNTRPGE